MANCDKCWNRDICKYADRARAFEDELDTWLNDTTTRGDKPEVTKVLVKCSQFKTDWSLNKKG